MIINIRTDFTLNEDYIKFNIDNAKSALSNNNRK